MTATTRSMATRRRSPVRRYDNDTLYGGADNDVLDGGAGNDTLSGESGQNALIGGLGDDKYLSTAPETRSSRPPGQGSLDRVVTSVSYTLSAGAEIEAFSTTAPAGTSAINLTGNEFANAITGNAGANMINGGLGKDILTGLGGADTFVFNTALGARTTSTPLRISPRATASRSTTRSSAWQARSVSWRARPSTPAPTPTMPATTSSTTRPPVRCSTMPMGPARWRLFSSPPSPANPCCMRQTSG